MDFILDAQSKREAHSDYWNFCIGSCHAATALRESYREQLKTLQRDIGFRYIRFHGLFNDDMGVIRRSLFGDYVLSFTLIDDIFDFFLSIGIRPFVEIGFMPECLASGDERLFHYKANVTPPKDEEAWSMLVESFVKHLIDRYGRDEVRRWYFEIWNEPNLCKDSGFKGGRFWSGNIEDYFRLYTITANAVKSVDSRLRVGGPATSNNALIPEMLDYCERSGTPIDFVTTHHYPTDVVLGYGVEDSQNFITAFNKAESADETQKILREYVTFQSNIWEKVDRGVLTDMAKRAKSEARGLPLFYTEWGSLAGLESDGPFGASFIAKTVEDNMGLADGYSFWTFSDIFEEKGVPNCAFHGGFGLMTLDGIKKAPYNAFLLLSKLAKERYTDIFRERTVDVYAFCDDERGIVQLLAVNHQSLMHSSDDETVEFTIRNADLLSSADVLRVDENHGNPLKEWLACGSPQYLNRRELYALESASELIAETIDVKDGSFTLTIPRQGIALITLYRK